MVWPPFSSGDCSGGWAGYGCRLMLELTALGKQQPCFALGTTSHPCSTVWGLSVSDPAEEQADWEGWSSRKAGSWLQGSLPSFLLPALGCWCPTPHAVLLGVFLWAHIPVGWSLALTAPFLHPHIPAIILLSFWSWSTMGWFNTYLDTRQEMGACRSKGQEAWEGRMW